MLNPRRRAAAAFLLCAALVLAGCAASPAQNPVTPPTPTPPQIQVANDIGALQTTLSAALAALQSASQQGKLSAADLTITETKIIAPIATAGKALNAELRSGDDWPTMKAKLLQIIASSGLANASAAIPAGARAALAAAVALYNSIAGTVGGPTL